MPTKRRSDLSTFDNRLLDGLNFCRKVYSLFDQIRKGANGITKLRLLETTTEKRLVEELIPIARYVQARYHEVRRIKVRWLSGSQSYDAILLSSGARVEHGLSPRRVFLEVTTSIHQNEHLVRQLVNEGEGSFGVKGVWRDKKTRKIISEPHVHHENELATDLADQIVDRLKSKSGKNYSPETVLVINCVTNSIILDPEWSAAIERVRKAKLHSAFQEVFLIDGRMSRSTTL